jgi:hypothetical protein
MQQTVNTRVKDEQGVALIAVLLLLMVMSALCTALATSSHTETIVARNHQVAAQARAAAEAGVIHAIELTIANLQSWQPNGFATPSAAMSRLLRGPDNNGATTADNGSLETFGIPRSPARLQLAGLPDVSYEVRLFDEDDPARGVTLSALDRTRIGEPGNQAAADENTRIVVRAIGYASGNAVATVEAMIAPLTLPAIVSNQSLTISGNPDVAGVQGSVHSNQNLLISGNPTIAENATASGTYTLTGASASIGGQSGSSFPNVPIPPIRAIDHLAKADFILNNDGTMTTVGTGATASCSPCAGAWEFSGGDWRIAGNTAPTIGTYYVEGTVTITGGIGSAASPAQISIIAEGSVELSGNPHLRPDSPELLLVTDGDLKVAGTVTAVTAEGQILVREQLMLAGNPDLAGQILIEDAANVSAMVTSNTISGNPTVTYNGISGTVGFSVSAWRRVQ